MANRRKKIMVAGNELRVTGKQVDAAGECESY